MEVNNKHGIKRGLRRSLRSSCDATRRVSTIALEMMHHAHTAMSVATVNP